MRDQYKLLSEKYELVKEQTEPVMEIDPKGTKAWYLNDKLHRTDGPAVEYSNGGKAWYLNGELHRTDGPAIERADGTKGWWLNDELHRVDGPAIEYANGTKVWYLNGIEYTEAEWKIQSQFQRGIADLAKFRVGVK
jgi:hypothetical protein